MSEIEVVCNSGFWKVHEDCDILFEAIGTENTMNYFG
jgi:hypothetical protein